MQIDQVVLIGAGNVGWHLGQQLRAQGVKVNTIYSRQRQKAETLAGKLDAIAVTNLHKIPALPNALYVLAVKDDVIETVAQELRHLNAANRLFVHTSGATSSTVLQPYFAHWGVFYPLQSFSKDRAIDFWQVPVCIHGSDKAVEAALVKLGDRISRQVSSIDDEQRRVLHVAAVFVNNFPNFLFTLGQEVVEQTAISFDLLRPLISETAAKVMENQPVDMQTGPARRHDERTISTHLQYLEGQLDKQSIYRLLTECILKKYPLEK